MGSEPSLLEKPVQVVTADVQATKDLLHSGRYRYLDVRTEEEFKNGHVENAFNIPYMFNTPEGRVKNPKFLELVLSVCSKEDHIVVGCQSGVRSVYATTDLLNAEFKHVLNMGGGYLDWVKKGFAVKKQLGEAEVSELNASTQSHLLNCKESFIVQIPEEPKQIPAGVSPVN